MKYLLTAAVLFGVVAPTVTTPAFAAQRCFYKRIEICRTYHGGVKRCGYQRERVCHQVPELRTKPIRSPIRDGIERVGK